MKSNFTIKLLLVMLAMMPVLVFSQNLSNAPIYQVSIGSQDFPLRGYVLLDIDKDGYRDWVISKANKLQVFKGVSGGFASSLSSVDALFTNGATDNSISNNRNILLMDVDNDGDSDMVFASNTSNDIVKAVYNSGTSRYDISQVIASANLSGTYLTLLAGDMNGDGRQDIVTVGKYSSGGIYWYRQESNGSYTKLTVKATAIGSNNDGVVNDFDGDGDKDIIVPGDDGKVHLFTNDGTGSFTETTPITNLNTGRTYSPQYSSFVVSDINNDGHKDIVIGSYSGVWVSAYLNNNNGTFTESVLRANNAAKNGGVFVSVTDIDGDGDIDVVAGRPVSPSGVSYFENVSNTSFAAETVLTTYTSSDLLTAGLADDFDGDGKTDYVNSYNAYINMNRSSQAFYTGVSGASISNTFIGGPGSAAITVDLSDPASANIKYNASGVVLTGVTVSNNNTSHVTITGSATNVEAGIKNITYLGTYRGLQYLDMAITSGAVTRTMRVNINITNSSFSILPVSFTNIQATTRQNDIIVSWQTASEVNADHFDIERSGDGTHFINVGTIAAHGNSNTKTDYSFTDKNAPAGINYYRIKDVDKDGQYTYSKIASATIKATATTMRLYPVPAADEINIVRQGEQKNNLTIYAADGKIVKQVILGRGVTKKTIPLSSLSKGTYLITDGEGHSVWFVRL